MPPETIARTRWSKPLCGSLAFVIGMTAPCMAFAPRNASADPPPAQKPTAGAGKSLAGNDYEGRPFVTQAAPALIFEIRSTPHLRGIDYPFAEQTARGVALLQRFPSFTLSDRRIFLSGPWYERRTEDIPFSRGVTAIEAMPNFRQGPTDVRNLPAARKWQLMGDPLFWGHAARLADELEQADPKDERIAPLRQFAVKHEFSAHQEAFTELGRRVWQGERLPADEKGQGVRYVVIDIEQTGGWEHQRDCFGWIYAGMISEAAKNGVKVVPVTYGQWTFEVGAVFFSMRQGGKGDPEYLLPNKDFLAAPDPTLTVCEENAGTISMDGYIQAIWGREPFYKRHPDGSLQLENGLPAFSDRTQTTAYGVELSLEPGEAEHCLQDLYRQAARMYLMYHRLAGAYPEDSTQRKPFLRNVRVGAWTRITNEGLQGIQQNDRPLPAWELEMLTGMYLLTADDLVVWSSDMNTPSGAPGADYTKAWKYNTHGVTEAVVKAAHRYSALDSLHTGPFQWCWFSLPMVNKNQSEGERYDQKPLAFGKLRTYKGRSWLELFAAYPALDGQSGDLQVWVEKDGKRSPTYNLQLANGRSYFYDAWQLPAELKDLKGKHVRFRFTDLLGKTHTWRGDWREPVDSP